MNRVLTHGATVVVFMCLGAAAPGASGRPTDPVVAARGVLERLLPGYADRFVLETIPAEAGRDVFEIDHRDGKIVLRGNTAISICSALNWYLKYRCFCHVSWCGRRLSLPEPLPLVESKIRRVSPHRYRYWFNYCAFSYSLAFWDWSQWEWMIDWMALHGINMPLAVTGQEAVWQAVGRRFGLTDEAMQAFLPGPAYLPFGWMGCLDCWVGPLPQSWIDSHIELERKILARERELGMTPILQGFTGHVPTALKGKFPNARFRQLHKWCGFPGTTFIDPTDPLFTEVGKVFLEEQTRLFGTDHFYASDTFIEMSPPSKDPAFLAAMGRAVYDAMAGVDPQAHWVMQGWIFRNNPKFWQPPQARALFGAVPDDRLILLEMGGDTYLVTEAYYGKPWLWCLIHNFGNTVWMGGNLARTVEHLGAAMRSSKRGKLMGMGGIMEGLGYDPVAFDLLTDLFWRTDMPELDTWISRYIHRRYGRQVPEEMREAWKLLLETVYTANRAPAEVICMRPTLKPRKRAFKIKILYDESKLVRAGRLMLACADRLSAEDTYRFDLVNITRQVLNDLAAGLYKQIVDAYQAGDRQRLVAAGGKLQELIRDMDTLLATRREFMLGPWLADAKRWATNEAERRLYEWNARNQITLWGPPNSWLHDYARKQWAGLLEAFYLPRWERFIRRLDEALAAGRAFDEEGFKKDMQEWEDGWTHGTEPYPTEPIGDSVRVARDLWAKYAGQLPGSARSESPPGVPSLVVR